MDCPLAVSTARAGNVIGGGDFSADRIVPDCVRTVEAGKDAVELRNPFSTRPYQHVLESIFAYLMIAKCQYEETAYAGHYNVGPDECDCVTTSELVTAFCASWNDGSGVAKLSWEDVSDPNAPHEANFLKLDTSKVKSVFGWQPRWHIDEAIRNTAEWYRIWMTGGDIRAEMDREIKDYICKSSPF